MPHGGGALTSRYNALPQAGVAGQHRRHAKENQLDQALGWLLPAVPEAGVVFDLVEGRVADAELAADALDRRPDVRPKAILPGPGDEAFVAQAVVDRAIGHERAGLRRQQIDNVVLAESEVDIDPVPQGAAC